MTTAFHKTLRSALFLSKCIGLIDITYTMEPTTGLLVHNVNSLFHICFEITRFIVLLMFSYMYIFHRLPSIMLAIGLLNSRTYPGAIINFFASNAVKITPLVTARILVSCDTAPAKCVLCFGAQTVNYR
ncbi:Uncharacterized protein FWK35_00029595, partial [Aphis craccivora]